MTDAAAPAVAPDQLYGIDDRSSDIFPARGWQAIDIEEYRAGFRRDPGIASLSPGPASREYPGTSGQDYLPWRDTLGILANLRQKAVVRCRLAQFDLTRAC